MPGMCLTNWVTIGRSGPTVDGRKIDPEALKAAAKNYNPETYTAIINYNHLYGNLGSVRELRAADKGDYVELQARLRPNLYYYMFNSNEMGLFFSMELVKNFAETKKPYLIGLAATDNPASLGTTELHFSADADRDNYMRGESVRLADAGLPARESLKSALLGALKDFFNHEPKEDDMTKEELTAAVAEAVNPLAGRLEKLEEKFSAPDNGDAAAGAGKSPVAPDDDYKAKYAALEGKYAELVGKYAELAGKVEAALKDVPGETEKNSTGAADGAAPFIM
ncbi:GPO family capsid scaffolding protein [Victivallis sp. Marseille-Q1083]|uniref:GPO family capsid scaffolding protein n=1 Tax=Victivallis sp. Marseille-Q1083 TaxID=2717288 RepID=UPI00158BC086|nr:GPO family capsid scaffolding protein [Victivallis sp. Marseille-Q1083]